MSTADKWATDKIATLEEQLRKARALLDEQQRALDDLREQLDASQRALTDAVDRLVEYTNDDLVRAAYAAQQRRERE